MAEAAVDWKRRGNAFLAEGKLDEAVACYRRAVEQSPSDPYAHLNLGFGLLEQEQFELAEECLSRAIAIDADIYDAHYLLGQSRASQGLFESAVVDFHRAVELKPDFDIGFRDLGSALERVGKIEQALTAYRQAILINPESVDVIHLLVQRLMRSEQFGEALNWLDRLEHSGDTSNAVRLRRSQALHELKRFDESLQVSDAILGVDGNDAQAWHAKGNALFALNQFDEALKAYEEALSREPEFVEAISNCGAVLQKLGRGEQSIEFLKRALSLRPDHHHAIYSLCFALMANGQGRESLELATRGIALAPGNADLHWNKAIAHLLLGEFSEGWMEYEWRWNANTHGARLLKPDLQEPNWTGQDLRDKSIILIHEQGLGDSIQFLRYASLVLSERAAKRVILKLPDALHPLLQTLPDGILLAKNDAPVPAFDFYCSMLSLPGAFGTTLETVPSPIPYLSSDPLMRKKWRSRLGQKSSLRVGIVWSGNAGHQNDHNRSIPLANILAHAPADCQFVSLQKEIRDYDLSTLERHPDVINVATELHSFAETAALIDCMDLVISVDTSVAHLAGALGKPLWLLLPKNPDWRWMLDREDSPWYPTARLFRQRTAGDWDEVLQRVMSALQDFKPTPP